MSSASAPNSPATGAIPFNRLQIGVVVVGVLVIFALAASSAYDAWRSYRYSIAATERELGNVANALAEQTVWSLEAVDLLLLDTVRWYRSESQGTPRDELDAALAARAAGVQPVREVIIMDAQGNPLYRSRGLPIPNHNAADRSYFIAQRDDANTGLFMSEPLTTRSEGRAAVILSRRIDDASGHFAGIVTANVDLEDLNQFYRAVDVGPENHIALLRDDGTLLVRNPHVPNIVGRRFPVLAAMPAGADARVINPIDGRSDFIAVAPVRNMPLRLTVTRDAKVALRPWRDETIRVALRTLIVVLLGALLLAVLLRQIKRVASGQRALRESEERYALAMEGANEGHWDWDVPADRLFLSPRMKVLDGQSIDTAVGSGVEWMRRIAMHDEDRPRRSRGRRQTDITHYEAGRVKRASNANIGCVTPTANGIGCWREAVVRSTPRAKHLDSSARQSISPARDKHSSRKNTWNRSCGIPKKWRPWVPWPAASPMTSTTCSERFSATANSPCSILPATAICAGISIM